MSVEISFLNYLKQESLYNWDIKECSWEESEKISNHDVVSWVFFTRLDRPHKGEVGRSLASQTGFILSLLPPLKPVGIGLLARQGVPSACFKSLQGTIVELEKLVRDWEGRE